MNAAALAAQLRLAPHPEGGFFRETYRSAATSVPGGFSGARSLSTAILFLLAEGQTSHLHRIKSDELWHYHLGGALRLTQIAPSGAVETALIGPDLQAGHKLQHAVPAGYWFGSQPETGAGFCLVGCTVAPGFDFADFELGERRALLQSYPLAREAIVRLTSDPSCG